MSSTPLRADLESIQVDARARPYRIIVDEIGGRFARVSEYVWQRLARGDQDPALQAQADAAGWTRQRNATARAKFSLLAIRIPLGGIDAVARWLAPISGMMFSVQAIVVWCMLFVAATMIAISRCSEIVSSLGSLAMFLQQSHPVWIAMVFVATKICHELGHAVMCRRMGSRCGEVGVLLLCGMPCPYCDVTNIWRQPSAIRRAATMLAGIYVELIIASLATLAWSLASDPAIRLMALNLMIVCGISTIVFNANPLMRYDGYFVLADLFGSTNLRQEARRAFQGVVIRRIAGSGYSIQRFTDRRNVLLAVYHAAAQVYRVLVSCAIATLIVGVADWMQLRWLAIALVSAAALMMVVAFAKRLIGVVGGYGAWQGVHGLRRGFSVGVLLLICVLLFLTPLPRYRRASGLVDAANATSVYLSENGLIRKVTADFGSEVRSGDPLVSLADEEHLIRGARLDGQWRLAKMRSNLSRRSALEAPQSSSPETAEHWKTLQAAEDAAEIQLVSARQRLLRTVVRAPVSGMVIPAKPVVNVSPSGHAVDLAGRNSAAGSTREAWCRISHDAALHAVLVIDARDRPHIQIGSQVMISLSRSPEDVIVTTIRSVSEIKQDDGGVVPQSAYQILCPLPGDLSASQSGSLLSMIGQECHGVVRLPRTSFATEFIAWMGDWIRG